MLLPRPVFGTVPVSKAVRAFQPPVVRRAFLSTSKKLQARNQIYDS
jgi:hypothetical protein